MTQKYLINVPNSFSATVRKLERGGLLRHAPIRLLEGIRMEPFEGLAVMLKDVPECRLLLINATDEERDSVVSAMLMSSEQHRANFNAMFDAILKRVHDAQGERGETP